MAVSARYTTMAAVLDHPINRAIAERELARRKRPLDRGMVPPPLPRKGGGAVFLTMREYQRNPKQVVPEGDDSDLLADVWRSPESQSDWWVTLTDGCEVGPYPNLQVAIENAKNLLAEEGYEILTEVPWSVEDAEQHPFVTTLL